MAVCGGVVGGLDVVATGGEASMRAGVLTGCVGGGECGQRVAEEDVKEDCEMEGSAVTKAVSGFMVT